MSLNDSARGRPGARVAPVETTEDLRVVRSDAFALRDDGGLEPTFTGAPPVVSLDRRFFGRLQDFETRFRNGPPSLRGCERFIIHGDVAF